MKKQIERWKDRTKCPICNFKLIKRNEGFVCKNSNCPLYFKLGKGWAYIVPNNTIEYFFKAKYDFDIERFKNKKLWLQLKSKKLYENGKCEICNSDKELVIHHILPRFSNPELTFDYENLMVLCKECHIKIHSEDKYRYNLK
jgi:5-methylcytosine-specific restriction enzyme A